MKHLQRSVDGENFTTCMDTNTKPIKVCDTDRNSFSNEDTPLAETKKRYVSL